MDETLYFLDRNGMYRLERAPQPEEQGTLVNMTETTDKNVDNITVNAWEQRV